LERKDDGVFSVRPEKVRKIIGLMLIYQVLEAEEYVIMAIVNPAFAMIPQWLSAIMIVSGGIVCGRGFPAMPGAGVRPAGRLGHELPV
jgi:hypothetical protein